MYLPDVQEHLLPKWGRQSMRWEIDERDAVGGEPSQEVSHVTAFAIGRPAANKDLITRCG